MSCWADSAPLRMVKWCGLVSKFHEVRTVLTNVHQVQSSDT
jgi:hypothetical protein